MKKSLVLGIQSYRQAQVVVKICPRRSGWICAKSCTHACPASSSLLLVWVGGLLSAHLKRPLPPHSPQNRAKQTVPSNLSLTDSVRLRWWEPFGLRAAPGVTLKRKVE